MPTLPRRYGVQDAASDTAIAMTVIPSVAQWVDKLAISCIRQALVRVTEGCVERLHRSLRPMNLLTGSILYYDKATLVES